jgi:cupin fold WbuC family metalloprotein
MGSIIAITHKDITELSAEARISDRFRKNRNFHTDYSDPINRLLNAFEPGTYVQPHRHTDPEKVEIFIIFAGRLLIVEFDDDGTPIDFCVLDQTEGVYALEVPPRVWHTAIALKRATVVYEIKNGPYCESTDKDFAPWAPKEGTSEGSDYNNALLKKIHLSRSIYDA